MTYVVKATFEKPNKGWYDTRELFVAYSDGTWEKITIRGFNITKNYPCWYRTDERLPAWKREMARYHRLENYIQPCNMVRNKMAKEEVHEYISNREENWNKN